MDYTDTDWTTAFVLNGRGNPLTTKRMKEDSDSSSRALPPPGKGEVGVGWIICDRTLSVRGYKKGRLLTALRKRF